MTTRSSRAGRPAPSRSLKAPNVVRPGVAPRAPRSGKFDPRRKDPVSTKWILSKVIELGPDAGRLRSAGPAVAAAESGATLEPLTSTLTEPAALPRSR